MSKLDFEWDARKAEANLAKRGISFDRAARVFDDIHGIHFADRSMRYDEERFVGIGLADGDVLTIIYTERGESIRLISARKATRYERGLYERTRTGEL
jgi:uncharacterized DUF497 family protein